jgi:two-component system osmolarity sensor histidine kinase EnvZ
MMWPRSLFGRNALLLIGLILSSQILALGLFGAMVLYPQAKRVADIVAQSVAAISTTLDAVPAEGRAALIESLNRSPYLSIRPGDEPPPEREGRPSLLERLFLLELVDRLSTQTDLEWRVSRGKIMWVRIELGGEPYWVAASAPNAMEPLAAGLASAALVSGLALIFGLFLTRQIVQPLRRLEVAADGLSLGAPGKPIAVSGPKEIAALAASSNRMSQRLALAEQDRALVLAGVSHDVRTPLAKLRLALEMIPIGDALRDTAVRQVERIDRLLRQFLDYARGSDVEPRQTYDLAALAREIAGECELDPQEAVVAPTAAVISGFPMGMRRALVNLVENALQYGAAPVVLTVSVEAGAVLISVRDHGSGVADDLLIALKSPFTRGPGAQGTSGSGLGLAIAERVAAMHGGVLAIANADGGGLLVRITLPSAGR